MIWIVVGVLALGAVVAAYSWFEAGWLRTRVRRGRGAGASRRRSTGFGSAISPTSTSARHSLAAMQRASAPRPGLRAGSPSSSASPGISSRCHAERRGCDGSSVSLDRPIVVLGNHDVAITRDPFSRAAELDDLADASLLRDSAVIVEVRGVQVQLVGSDPKKHAARTTAPWSLADLSAAFRILLCHYPSLARRVPPGIFGLTLAGHMHAGQICIPLPGGRRLTLAHLRAEFVSGLYASPAGPMHVSPGTGTTLVPFRLFARPEVTELVLPARRPRRQARRRRADRLHRVEGHSVISSDLLGAYAADAAREVEGVRGLVESPLHRHKGVRVVEEDGVLTLELQLILDWGAAAPEVGLEVQERVAAYLGKMAAVTPRQVEVVVAEIGAPSTTA